MKQVTKLIVIIISLILLSSTQLALAQEKQPPQGKPGGLRGEVTAVGDSSLTVANRAGDSITINVKPETIIQLVAEGREGSLADIEVGNFVGVRGRKNEEDSVDARLIIVLTENPKNLARARGRIRAIEDDMITIENRQGTQQITTNADTNFWLGREKAELSDIQIDDPIFAIGVKQDEGQFLARTVVVVTGEQISKHTLRGEVLSVDIDAGIVTVEAKGQKEGTWTVQTTDKTRYRAPGVENPTLAGVKVGDHILVIGRPAKDGSKTGTAHFIIIIPAALQNSIRMRGEVTAIDGITFTLASRRGELTILTDETTQYLSRGDQEVSFADIEVGSKVIIAGQRVEDQERTLLAKIVGIRLQK